MYYNYMNAKYNFINNKFIINDYLHAKKFSSFLPGIGGIKGKPIWCFYANVGQCIGGFGINSKDTPIAPFDSAYLAYQNIPIRGFNSLLEINGNIYHLFDKNNQSQTSLEIVRDSISIKEETDAFIFQVIYSSLSNHEHGGLIRKVIITNKTKSNAKMRLIDGLSVMLPYGLSNYCFQNLSTLMSSYCAVNLNNNVPYMTFKGGEDNAQVSRNNKGNAFFALNQNNQTLKAIVDPNLIYDDGVTSSLSFNHLNNNQILEGQIPCGMVFDEFCLKENETYSFISYYGSFDSIIDLNNFKKSLSYTSLNNEILNTKLLINTLTKVSSHTSSDIFDEFIKQSYFDNALRGGFPTVVGNKIAYLFSRKHGDMERDYNDFVIPYTYFSAGPGNFRDVNQNRRNDLYIEPKIFDKNVYEFFSLLQLDGYNPLTVEPESYHLDLKYLKDFDQKYLTFDFTNFTLSDLSNFIQSQGLKESDFDKLISLSEENINAKSKEGYWIDHWTYNTDLLENFISVYPDQFSNILKDKKYRYFNGEIKVEPRKRKYKVFDGKIRQYNATREAKVEDNWIKDANGKTIFVSLQSKIFFLILIKSLSLDPKQLGIEMEADKPGWNDALNGLPGLLGSSLNETIELLRLAKLYQRYVHDDIDVLKEQNDLFYKAHALFSKKDISHFDFWNESSFIKEEYREKIYQSVNGESALINKTDIELFLNNLINKLDEAIVRSRTFGILPTYFIYDVDKYELDNDHVIVKSFKVKPLNEFLEVYTHLGKLGSNYFTNEDYLIIKNTDIYDPKLHLYKTCGSIEHESFELGRIRSFSPGWLERECGFLHMSYKYLVSLLDSKQYENYFNECRHILTFMRDKEEYGRNPIEASSFIVPSCNKNPRLHGQGFLARLTGANAEVIDLFYKTFIGEHLFTFKNNELSLSINPKIPVELFTNNRLEISIFSKQKIIFINEKLLKPEQINHLSYRVNKVDYDNLPEDLCLSFRNGLIDTIEVIIS